MNNVLSIQEIVNQRGSIKTHLKTRILTPKEMIDLPLLLTKDEVVELGFISSECEPEPNTCSFCGSKLPFMARRSVMKNEIMSWVPSQCDCERAVELRAKVEEEEEKKKQEAAEAERRAEMQRRVDKLFRQSKLGERFKKRTFESFKPDKNTLKAFESCKKFSDMFGAFKKTGTGIMLAGPYGTGKTHLAAAIANNLINNGVPVIFGTLISLLGVIRQSYSDAWSQEDELSILNLYNTVDLLIVDDLGKERPSEWVLEKLFTIVNARYENYKPIVFTTNYDIAALKKRLTVGGNIETAESIVSRLYESCRGIFVNGEDYRMKGR